MSIIIGVKYKDGVLLGSDTQATNRGHIAEEIETKIYQSKYSTTAIGCVGSCRDNNLIETQEEWIDYKDILDKVDINKKYVISNIITKLFNLLRNNHRLNSEKGLEFSESDFIFATSEKLFGIYTDGSVLEEDKYVAIGCGEELVRGLLDSYFHTNNITSGEQISYNSAKEMIRTSVLSACSKDVFINDNITYINLKRKSNDNDNE